MNDEKKLTVKRLAIFLVISFLPFIVIIPIMWNNLGGPIYAMLDNENAAVSSYILGVFGMMIPSAANILTRLITKEGFHNTYLGLNTEGKMGYYAASVAVKLAESVLCTILIWALFLGGSFSETFSFDSTDPLGLFLLQTAFCIIIFFPAFGEEWGWRGYMMPKLLTLMPKPAAIVTGGVIWGLWHAPLTVAGHNFGVDYPGYPWVGIILMCLMCTLFNSFLTLITEKTRSVYPAAFCHSVNNSLGVGVMFSIFGTETAVERLDNIDDITFYIPYFCVICITATVSFILFTKKERKEADA